MSGYTEELDDQRKERLRDPNDPISDSVLAKISPRDLTLKTNSLIQQIRDPGNDNPVRLAIDNKYSGKLRELQEAATEIFAHHGIKIEPGGGNWSTKAVGKDNAGKSLHSALVFYVYDRNPDPIKLRLAFDDLNFAAGAHRHSMEFESGVDLIEQTGKPRQRTQATLLQRCVNMVRSEGRGGGIT